MTIDSGFLPPSTSSWFGGGEVYVVTLQPDNKILLWWYSATHHLIRLNTDGSIDTWFTLVGFLNQIAAVFVQSDGKILVWWNLPLTPMLLRLNSDGSTDTWFNVWWTGFNAAVNGVAVQSDGKILVGWTFTAYNGVTANRLIRLQGDGSIDTWFNFWWSGFNAGVNAVFMQPDGKILVGWPFTNYNGTSGGRIIRLQEDGSIDTWFNVWWTGFNAGVTSITVQSDGKIVLWWAFTYYNGVSSSRVIRLNSDGSRDTWFNIWSGSNSFVSSVALQSDGKILIWWQFTSYNGVSANRLVRINSNWSIDTTFDIGTGLNNRSNSLAVQSDGKIVVWWVFTNYNGLPVTGAVVRFIPPVASDATPDSFDLWWPLTWFSSWIDLNTDYYSSGVVVMGIDTAATVTITWGTYSINSGAYTDVTGSVVSGDLVVVKLTSAGGYNQTTDALLTIWWVTDIFSITTIPPAWSSTITVTKDSCPDGDYSPTPYDHECRTHLSSVQENGTNPVQTPPTLSEETWAVSIGGGAGSSSGLIVNSGSVQTGDSASWEGVCPESEMQWTYGFSSKYNITTMQTCIKADMYGNIARRDIAKMISNFAMNVMNRKPDTKKKCEFDDMVDADREYQHYATLVCQLWLMWINNETSEQLPLFKKDNVLTRGEFAAIISRLLFGALYNVDGGNNWYEKHMTILEEKHILIKDDPYMIEKRGYVMLMLQRVGDMK